MHAPIAFGRAAPKRYIAKTGAGATTDASYAIFPIVSQKVDGTLVPIGTGFFVAENGIFLTAAHVVAAMLSPDGQATGPFGLFQFRPGGKYYIRPINRTTHHANADVAVGVAAPMNHNETGEPMPNSIMRLAKDAPCIDETVCTYAFPGTTVQPGKPQRVDFTPGYYEGKLVAAFPSGRDRVVLPGPCFETSIVIHGGASGGPVVNTAGSVFAVNSTSLGGERVSYVSSIEPALDLAITDVKLPGDAAPRTTSLRELIDRRFVICD